MHSSKCIYFQGKSAWAYNKLKTLVTLKLIKIIVMPCNQMISIHLTQSTDPTDPSDTMNQTNSTGSIINTSCNGEYHMCTESQVSVLVKFYTKYGSLYHINIIAYQIAASCVTCSAIVFHVTLIPQ